MPLIRPKLLIETARIGARLYRRERDLAGAVCGLAHASPEQIVARLSDAEHDCEALRRARAPTYRPAAHVQVLAALLAEAGRARSRAADQAKASGSASLRLAM
ncbi:MAG TPA: DUF6477 family protein [Thermohalobaculum sp.]|nr:DUF6477 family protein [Thermohalobaculum sp.]